MTRGSRPGPRRRTRVRAYECGEMRGRTDTLATEEPLEVRLAAGGHTVRLAVTMRTPGDDFELAAGFLHGEGVISSRDDLVAIRYCVDRELGEEQRFNVVTVDLDRPQLPDLRGLDRHFTTTSACGVCGRSCLESLAFPDPPERDGDVRIAPEVLAALPRSLRDAQPVFDRTGGLHAAALFTSKGELVAAREDVGRHNAMDKLIGWALLQGKLPLRHRLLLVSGRASYELAQKAAVAGAPILCAVSAPSSLAVDVARRAEMTLVAFLRGERFNVYAGEERIDS
jgi:FdhD protein